MRLHPILRIDSATAEVRQGLWPRFWDTAPHFYSDTPPNTFNYNAAKSHYLYVQTKDGHPVPLTIGPRPLLIILASLAVPIGWGQGVDRKGKLDP